MTDTRWPDCTCGAPEDVDAEDHDHDCPEHVCWSDCEQAEET